ncbi:MFS transporter [Cryobacterium sp. BB307]|uniref:MFS transporter n=1 Tax=Cryobacterium sp. BB307 TaxID=2716317 RepID=UPI001445B24C|nr:MFS transporter [Cryobacterium sp. BB307]
MTTIEEQDHKAVDKSTLVSPSERRRALAGSAVGSAVEWYDFFLYGTMSALVFGPLFFRTDDATLSTMLALAAFALSFLIRPIGGIVFSHLGDRIGRKKTLVITLTMMGVATVLIGLLPTYDTIGVWAPILLTFLRLVQGLALGGEWGGGLLMAVEYSPRKRRGLWGAVPQTGALLGLALGNLAATASLAIFPEDAFLSIGWRIPFIISVVLVAVGLWIRHAVDETPSFKKVVAANATAKVPLLLTLKRNWRQVIMVILAKFIETATFFLFATFSVGYAVTLGYTQTEALNAVLIAAVLAIPAMLGWGAISDKIGRKKVFIGGAIAVALYTVPFLWMMNQMSFGALLAALVIGFSIIWASYGSILGTFFAEAFPADVRYTGASLGYQVGAAIAGGPVPLIATAIVAGANNYGGIGILIGVCAIISIVAVLFAKDRSGQELD